ncbi:hypothetical protein DERP_011483 [Dermatophagoides pteronyssinus]|uniref:Uncharacterized protein n=1 Tax=Dermatophagoides pteronyssinus TaxID=6956 RepID=A0ABQ8J5G5_DERPT|nr:hypothetical protein DERP_011483 [Dermatophagoides pteronyssinus]
MFIDDDHYDSIRFVMFNVAVVNCNLKNYAGAQNYHFVLIIFKRVGLVILFCVYQLLSRIQ